MKAILLKSDWARSFLSACFLAELFTSKWNHLFLFFARFMWFCYFYQNSRGRTLFGSVICAAVRLSYCLCAHAAAILLSLKLRNFELQSRDLWFWLLFDLITKVYVLIKLYVVCRQRVSLATTSICIELHEPDEK